MHPWLAPYPPLSPRDHPQWVQFLGDPPPTTITRAAPSPMSHSGGCLSRNQRAIIHVWDLGLSNAGGVGVFDVAQVAGGEPES